MVESLQKIVVPFIDTKRLELGLDPMHPALVILDGQSITDFYKLLVNHNIRYVSVPANFTDKL